MIPVHMKVPEFDVLVVGGGIGGMMAAIAAAEEGASVAVAEKANTLRSGSGATGNDHFVCYLPEAHGGDIEQFVEDYINGPLGLCCDRSLTRVFAQQSFKRVLDWERFGIPMRPHGEYEFTGHGIPGKPIITLKYAGINQKRLLTSQALAAGVRIFNRMAVNTLITDDSGAIIGAVGVDISGESPAVGVFRAKNVVLATGNTSRLYTPKTGALMFNVANCPACAGGGRAMAYRAGAKLVNLDLPHAHAGPRNLNRCGKGTWIGVYRDIQGNPIGQFVTRPTKLLGDATGDHWADMFRVKFSQGEAVYMDCTQTDPEDMDYMYWGLSNEGNTATLQHMKDCGIDLAKHMVEFTQYEPILVGRGVETDVDAAAGIPGLYAAGEETGNFRGDIAGAATFGWIAGKSAAARAKETVFAPAEESPEVAARTELYDKLMSRPAGAQTAGWKECNIAVQQIMSQYAGIEVRSEHLFMSGLAYLDQLEKRIGREMGASNAHELSRCLEVLDLLDVGRLVMQCSRERRETRHLHRRADFPYTSPMYNNQFLTVQKGANGGPVLNWRQRA